MTTALITHPDCLEHVNPPGHPESVARLEAVMAALAAPAFDTLHRVEAGLADDSLLELAHSRPHIDRIRAGVPDRGWAQLDADTAMSPGSLTAALRAVGGVTDAVDMVLRGDALSAFVACRPPGHHAERARPMGFCLFSNIAIAALHALEHHGLARVAVLDFDVHHGNGTQDVLWNEARALFVSSHQMPLYPGTGAASETGAHDNILNMPLAPGTGSAEMRAAWQGALARVADFAPELILVSAGFDAHARDPLGGLDWQDRDYAWLTGAICDLARKTCDGRVVSALEGGYDLEALAGATAAHVSALME
ncbi:MAG TPA: histone deacetylase family protein [Aliiroseovarius sp.]|nr:histone deacetylase family protein [Aliiroseovarius sp.]